MSLCSVALDPVVIIKELVESLQWYIHVLHSISSIWCNFSVFVIISRWSLIGCGNPT